MKFVKSQPIISLEDFLSKAKKIKEFTSSLGRRYRVNYIIGDVLHFTRLDADTDQDWHFDLNNIYDAYAELEDFSAISFKKYVPRKHSPARGLLLALDLIHQTN